MVRQNKVIFLATIPVSPPNSSQIIFYLLKKIYVLQAVQRLYISFEVTYFASFCLTLCS